MNHFGEVQFFFRSDIRGEVIALALVSEFGPPDNELLAESSNALWVSHYLGNQNLRIIEIKSISTCVAMVPFTKPPDGRFFVCEKMGLEVGSLGEPADDEDDIYV
jgi:hypothetical protein